MEVNIGAVCTDVSVGLGCSENTALSYFGSEKKKRKKKGKGSVLCACLRTKAQSPDSWASGWGGGGGLREAYSWESVTLGSSPSAKWKTKRWTLAPSYRTSSLQVGGIY